MTSVNKEWLKDVKAGIGSEKNLYDYATTLSGNYKCSSLIEIVMEYMTLYEMWAENLNPYISVADDESRIVHEAVRKIAKGVSIHDMTDVFFKARDTIIKKMQVVTAYVDRFLIYEHVLNRIEFKYTLTETERKEELSAWNKEQYVGDLLKYIFEYEDNVVVNDRVHDILEQLPVRMARSKFLELVKNSIRLYKDSDKHSLDGYVYMLRTSAMIYEPEEMDIYFTEFKELLDELSVVDFTDIGEEYFIILQEKINNTSHKLQDISDVYMVFQKLINMLYSYAINEDCDYDEDEITICSDVLMKLSDAFDDDAEKEMDSSVLLGGLEGSMEKLYDEKLLLESILDDVMLSFGQIIDKENLKSVYDGLKLSQTLFSTSLFAELGEIIEEPVTSEYLNEVSDILTEDLLEIIRKSKRPVIRAIMASTISKLPTFFSNSKEVMDYIQNAFSQCSDDVEFISSIRLLDELTEY